MQQDNRSFIKILRKFTEWQWYNKSEMVHLFIHLLLKANYAKGNFQGQDVERGQLISGLQKLNKDTGISEQSIRTCLNRLKSTGEITIKSTNKFSLITIVKYEDYQDHKIKSTSKSTSKSTNDQQTTNKQSTTIEEVKEGKEIKNIFFKEILLSQNIWMDSICIKHKLKLHSQIEPLLKQYETHLVATKQVHATEKEYAQHFSNWLGKQPLQQIETVNKLSYSIKK